MSTQSILHKDRDNLLYLADKLFICMADKYLFKVRFGIGDSYCKKDYIDLIKLRDILCSNACELQSVIEKVEEKLNLLIIKYS